MTRLRVIVGAGQPSTAFRRLRGKVVDGGHLSPDSPRPSTPNSCVDGPIMPGRDG